MQFKYLVACRPVLFSADTEKIIDPLKKEKAQLEDLKTGRYKIFFTINANFRNKWVEVH